ncbi:hypothetical protein AL073_01860 [Loktanella sp. 1ANDIMAR09]|nr:hypothetical protein AL073_01860 [Loktanella sp. 1ANDIMAR09]
MLRNIKISLWGLMAGLTALWLLAKAAGVTLHILINDQDGFLNADKLSAAVPDWATASVWF